MKVLEQTRPIQVLAPLGERYFHGLGLYSKQWATDYNILRVMIL